MIQNTKTSNKINFKNLAYIKGTPEEIKTVKTLIKEAETYTLKYTNDLQTDIFATNIEKDTIQDYKKLLRSSKERVRKLGNSIDENFEQEHAREYFPFNLNAPQNALKAEDVIKAIDSKNFDTNTLTIITK